MTITHALSLATVCGTAVLAVTLDVRALAMWLLSRWGAPR